MPALVAGIYVFRPRQNKDVDGRNKSSHDELSEKPELLRGKSRCLEAILLLVAQLALEILQRDLNG